MGIVKWNPVSELVAQVLQPPKPARQSQPEWFKKYPAFHTPKPEFFDDGKPNSTLKQCMPFIDAMSVGYIVESWQDIRFEFFDDLNVKYSTPTKPNIISHREHSSLRMGPEFYPIEFVLHLPYFPELPAGWSMLLTQPMNRPELPFHFLSGIIDSDSYLVGNETTNIPFYVKKSAPDVIPAGTPLLQMVPIRREGWRSKAMNFNLAKQNRMAYLIGSRFNGAYKKLFWSKKSYK